jgi:hypothetical protein
VFFKALVFRRGSFVLFVDALAATERARVSTLGKPLVIKSAFTQFSTTTVSTYVVNALLMEQVATLRQASSCLLDLKVAKTNQATVSSLQVHSVRVVFTFGLGSHYRHETIRRSRISGSGGAVLDWLRYNEFVDATRVLDVILGCNRCFRRSQERGEQHHVFVSRVLREKTGCRKDGVVFRVRSAKDVDDPAAAVTIAVLRVRALRSVTRRRARQRRNIVRLDDTIATRVTRSEAGIVNVGCSVGATMAAEMVGFSRLGQ